MKKAVSLLAALFLLLSLSGCGLENSQSSLGMVYTNTAESVKGEKLTGKELVKVASNSKFSLAVIPDTGYFEVTDLSDGYVYTSYPNNNTLTENDLYQLKSTIAFEYGDMVNRVTSTANSYSDSILQNAHSLYKTKNGFLEYFNFPSISVTVPVCITLNDEGISAEILVSQIEEKGNYKVTKLELLSHFAAGGFRDKGYMVVPDSSGAVINFSNGKHTYPALNIPVYGKDSSLGEADINKSIAYMPIFGIKNGNHAVLSIIEKGDAHAIINAHVSGSEQSYNRAYPSFVLRDSATVSVGTTSVGYSSSTFTIYDETEQTLNLISVKYILLSGDDVDYTDMAGAYNSYLKSCGSKAKTQEKSVLYLNMIGSVKVEQNILGIVSKKAVSTSSFGNIEKLVTDFANSGINNIKVRIDSFSQTDSKNSIVKTVVPLSSLGGKKGLENLAESVSSLGGRLYGAVDIFHIKSSNKYGVRSVNRRLVEIYPIAQNTLEYNKEAEKCSLLSPVFFESASQRVLSGFKQYNMGISYSVEDDTLYSDYGDNYSKRQKTCEILKSVYKLSSKQTIGDYKTSAFLVPYCDDVFELGGKFMHYDTEDYQIPFYQLAVSDLVGYSYEPINLSLDSKKAFMRSLEYGAGLSYTMITENSNQIGKSDNTSLYNCEAEKLFNGAVDYANKALSFYKKVGNRLIAHEKLDEDVYISEYTGGKAVFNYSQKDYSFNGTVVNSGTYMVVESGVE